MTGTEARWASFSMGSVPTSVTVHEVGPREGLQSQSKVLATENKRSFVESLVRSGLRRIEVTGFFHPVRVPQLADAAELVSGLTRDSGTRFAVHVPNRIGLDRALAVGIDEVIICLSASDETARREDDDCGSTAECQRKVESLVDQSREAGVWTRVFLTNTWGCPYVGKIAPDRVRRIVAELSDAGVDEVCLADTLAAATPADVEEVLDLVCADLAPDRLALHFHDNRGMALANTLVGLGHGISTVDSGVAGLGGHGMCNYVPTYPQMLATEDLLFMLAGLGVDTGVDLEAVRAAGHAVGRMLGVPLAGRYANSGPVERIP
jgi:hydroxymethylglutaryl-CoA lyase